MSLLKYGHEMKHQGVFTPKEFQKIQEDLCRFLLHEVCHDSGVYFDPWSELREQKYLPLVHWDKDGFFRTQSQEYRVPGKYVWDNSVGVHVYLIEYIPQL